MPLVLLGGRGLRLALAAILPPLLMILSLQVRWGLFDPWLPAGLDTSTELMPAERLRRDLQRHPAVWNALKEAPLIVGNRYDLPGFLALALGPEHRADYTTFNPDARGFAWWQPADGYVGRHGVIFGIREPGRPLVPVFWAPWLGSLEPLGRVDIERAGRTALRLEFFRFGPLPHPWPRFYGPGAVVGGAP